MKKYLAIILIAVLVCVMSLFALSKIKHNPSIIEKPSPITNNQTSSFDFKMIKEVQKTHKENYMISPLSIATALKMVSEGANGNTKAQIDNLLKDYTINNNLNVKDRISIANLIFIRDTYKNDIKEEFKNKIKTNYDSEVMYDEFKTPKPVNDWISKKTYNMINNVIDDLSSDFVLGLANAIAIDVEWENKFECNKTTKEVFTKDDNTTVDVAMMHSTNDITYIENNNAKGIIKDYAVYDKETGKIVDERNENTVELEYIAILPNTNIDDYINKLDNNELNNLLSNKKEASKNLDINLSLPKYTYDFDYKDFQDGLINLGITDAFNSSNANFSNISDIKIFISKAIHKSHIELSENGTKAAAVTVFIFEKNAMVENKKEVIDIKFNKPFIYIIKEKNSNNIWFFGTVYEPLKWEENDINNCKID